MKKILLLCLSLLLVSCSKNNATESLNNSSPVRFVYNQKYGLFNPETKEVVLYPRYSYIEPFSNGFALGITGNEGDVCDIIDTSGSVLYSYKTEPLSHTYCYNGFFYFVNDSNESYYHGLYNYKGEQVFKSDFIYSMNSECIITKEKSNYVFIFFDNKGIKQKKLLLPDTYSYEPFSNGFARFYGYNNNEKVFGMIKSDKKIAIPPKYKQLGAEFKEGLLIAEDENSLYGLLNKEGDWVIQPKYNQLFNYSGKVLAAKIKNWKLIDLKENIKKTFPDNFTVISDFVENIAIFSMTIDGSTKYGLMNTQGDFVLNATCEKILPNPDNGYWQILVNNKWKMFKENIGLINTEEYLDFSKVN